MTDAQLQTLFFAFLFFFGVFLGLILGLMLGKWWGQFTAEVERAEDNFRWKDDARYRR